MNKPVIASLSIKGQKFEILVDPEEAIKIKFENKGDIRKALVVDQIFKDARKGDVAGSLEKYFNTDDVYAIALKIIKEGEVPIPAEYKKKQIEQLKKKIIDELSHELIDANTHLPIPPTRLENAINQIGYNFSANKSESDIKKELIEKLRVILPIKYGVERYSITVDLNYLNQVASLLKKLCTVTKIEKTDKNAVILIELPIAKEQEVINKVNAITNNSAIISKI